jgi:hypothetical protein
MDQLLKLLSIENLILVMDEITRSPVSTILSALGFLLLLLGFFLVWKWAKSDPSTLPPRWALFTYVTLGAAVVLTLSGQALTVINLKQGRIQTLQIPAKIVYARLLENKRTDWLIRLIPYDSKNPTEQMLSYPPSLGPRHHRYTFVTAYSELRGYTVQQAIEKTGGRRDRRNVTAIIFNRNGTDIFPANVRGVLQVIHKIDNESNEEGNKDDWTKQNNGCVQKTQDPSYNCFPFDQLFAADPSQFFGNLRSTNIESWAFRNYSQYFDRYCQAVLELVRNRTNPYSAIKRMGQIVDDWNPLGYSQIKPVAFSPDYS